MNEETGLIRHVFILASLGILIAGCGPSLVESDDIRTIENSSELNLDQIDLDDLSPIGPRRGLETARKQAKEWSKDAALVAIFQSAFLVSEEGKVQPLLWTYRFKNSTEDAWLGVVLGSGGIETVMQRQLPGNVLTKWRTIEETIDSADLDLYEDGYSAIMSFRFDAKDTLVWIDDKTVWVGSIPAADAVTGERLDWKPILDQLQSRRSFFDAPLAQVSYDDDPYSKGTFFPAGSRAISSHW